MIAQVILHPTSNSKLISNLMAVKLDMQRAYDHMNWPFICAVLRSFGFHEERISNVKARITCLGFVVLINRVSIDWFKSIWGRRKSDLISPYLFILGIEVLVKEIRDAAVTGKVSGFQAIRGIIIINQLAFADIAYY